MIAELLLLQGLLDKSQLVTPPKLSQSTSTSTYEETVNKVKESVNKYKQAYEDKIDRGRRGYGL